MTQRPAAFVIGSPVAGYISPVNAPTAVGSFKVTSTFAQHVASGRGRGIDLGNGRCGDPIIARHSGKVTLAGLYGSGPYGPANIVRFKHPNGTDESGDAHLATIGINPRTGAKWKVGDAINRGEREGTLGMTGANACHLHGGYTRNGVEIDWWLLLEQNHSVQVNAGATGVNLRNAPAGGVVAVVKSDGIFATWGPKLGDHDTLLTPRPVASVVKALNGVNYEWLPRAVGGQAIWVARQFIHFV